MFISCHYIRCARPPNKYKLIDTDFEEIMEESGIATQLIEVYRKRNLPVVPNLILFWQFASKKDSYSMDQMINWSKQNNPYYAEYEDEINKYLLLL